MQSLENWCTERSLHYNINFKFTAQQNTALNTGAPLHTQGRPRWGQEQDQLLLTQQCTLGTHKMGVRWCSRARAQVKSSMGGILGGCSPSGSAPSPATSQPQDIHIVQKWSRGWLLLQRRSRPCPGGAQWQPWSKEGALLNIQCRLWSPQHQSHLLSRGK